MINNIIILEFRIQTMVSNSIHCHTFVSNVQNLQLLEKVFFLLFDTITGINASIWHYILLSVRFLFTHLTFVPHFILFVQSLATIQVENCDRFSIKHRQPNEGSWFQTLWRRKGQMPMIEHAVLNLIGFLPWLRHTYTHKRVRTTLWLMKIHLNPHTSNS